VQNLLKAFGQFYIYSSVHIAICAGLLTLESYIVLDIDINLDVILFVTFATMSIYSLHRLVGMSKVKAFDHQGRYLLIKKFRHHILLYFLISALASAYYFLQLPKEKMVLLLIPGLITLAYVLPIFKNKKRLRDLPYLKIFVIAVVWAILSLILPAYDISNVFFPLLILERIIFFIAITIPFDIRDIEVDQSINVKTLVHLLGIRKSKKLAQVLLLLATAIITFLYLQDYISGSILLALLSTYLVCATLIFYSNATKGDWYFGGLLDGTIGLRVLLMGFFIYLLH